jgi:glycosyltransferase involved in cell wall biosynthesis
MTDRPAASKAPRPGLTILHVITGLGDGGAEGALYRLCKFDSANRHVVISLMDGGKYRPLLEELGNEVSCLGMRQGRVSADGLLRLARLIRRHRPDLVQTWLYHADLIGGVVARLLGVPRVYWGIRHATLLPGKVKRSTIAIARLSARLSRVVPHRIICCSHGAQEAHVALGYDPAKFVIIPNGYDLARLTPDESLRARFRHELGVADDDLLVGMVSRFDPQKDHGNLLDALAALAARGLAFRCVLVGTGMNEANPVLMAMVRERGLEHRVSLLGRRDDVPAVMNGLDIHLLSSASEAFPNVVAEAMACGTPCVTTNVGDAGLIVGAAGWVVPPGRPDLFADAVASAAELRADPAKWRKLEEQARAHIQQHFTVAAMVEAYNACWSEAG